MKFQAMRSCQRPVREQKYIWGLLEAWPSLPEGRRRELLAMIDELVDDATEGLALYKVLRGSAPEVVAARTGVSARRLYKLRCRFYDRVEIR